MVALIFKQFKCLFWGGIVRKLYVTFGAYSGAVSILSYSYGSCCLHLVKAAELTPLSMNLFALSCCSVVKAAAAELSACACCRTESCYVKKITGWAACALQKKKKKSSQMLIVVAMIMFTLKKKKGVLWGKHSFTLHIGVILRPRLCVTLQVDSRV